jgi:hypothetical protein
MVAKKPMTRTYTAEEARAILARALEHQQGAMTHEELQAAAR